MLLYKFHFPPLPSFVFPIEESIEVAVLFWEERRGFASGKSMGKALIHYNPTLNQPHQAVGVSKHESSGSIYFDPCLEVNPTDLLDLFPKKHCCDWSIRPFTVKILVKPEYCI